MTALAHSRPTKSAGRATVVSLAVVAVIVGFTSAFAYSQAGQINVSDELRSADTRTPVGAMEASRVTRCIMPSTWRRDCGN